MDREIKGNVEQRPVLLCNNALKSNPLFGRNRLIVLLRRLMMMTTMMVMVVMMMMLMMMMMMVMMVVMLMMAMTNYVTCESAIGVRSGDDELM